MKKNGGKFIKVASKNLQADEVLILNTNKTIDKKSAPKPYIRVLA